MTRAAVLLAALAAPAAAAQSVVVGGWALPAGAVVTAVGRQDFEATAFLGDSDEGAFDLTSRSSDSLVVRVRAVAGGRLAETEQRLVRQVTRDEVAVGEGRTASETHDALVGADVRTVRAGGGWARTLAGGAPTPQQAAELAGHTQLDDLEYPLDPVRVGEAWDVDSATVAALYGPLAPGYAPRLTVRLDSVGTYGGGPAAYLSQDVDLVLLQAAPGRPTVQVGMEMHARVVRRLDWQVDVLTAWEGPVWMEMETPDGLLVLEGEMRRGDRVDVALPGEGDRE